MRILLTCVAAAAVLAACSGSNEDAPVSAEMDAAAVDSTTSATTVTTASEEAQQYDTSAFLENITMLGQNPALFAETMMREQRVEIRAYGGREEPALTDIIYSVQEMVFENVLGDRPQRISSYSSDWRARNEYREHFNAARTGLRGFARGILSNPVFVRLIGERVVSHVQNAGVDQQLFVMLRNARPVLERDFTLLAGVDDRWLPQYRRQTEGFDELFGTASMRGVCGETLPRDCVEAHYFLIRRYRDGGIENVSAWQQVGLSVLQTLEARPEFAGL